MEGQSRSGSSPLEAAAASGEALIVELLLTRRASTEQSESSTWGPIHLAAGVGHMEVLRLLLQKGANVDALTKDGNTALHLAVEERRRACARLLLASGATADVRNSGDGDTPLHIAASLGDEHMVRLLLLKEPTKISETGLENLLTMLQPSSGIICCLMHSNLETVYVLLHERVK